MRAKSSYSPALILAVAAIAVTAAAIPSWAEQGQYLGNVALTPSALNVTGSWSMASRTGTIAAGATANIPVFAFRYTGTGFAVIRKVGITVSDVSTAFTAGIASFDMFAARTFTAQDTGGTALTVSGNNGKLRTSYSSSTAALIMIAATGAMTAGTRTLDSTAIGSITVGVSTTADAILINPATPLFQADASNGPLILVASEGFVIQATVPATGTWVMSVQVQWDEVTAF